MIKLIKKYLSIFSVSGSEENLAATIKSDISPFVDSVTIDAMGNLIAYKKGSDSSKKIMLAAHMDEIGFVVTFIEDNGFIRVAPVGGIRAIASSYSEVVFENGSKGVLVLEDGLVASDVSPKKLVVDIGAKNKKEAAKKVSVGEYLSLTQRITRLFGNRYAAKAFDDRVACAVLVQTAINSKLLKYDT
ncbi:MAG: M42 family peptidase, partial [Clostridia bacterium]